MRVSLRAMHLTMQITKEMNLKALQQRETKEREHHQHRTTQLDEFQDISEQFVLKALNGLQAVQESRKEVTAKIFKHPCEQDVADCMEINDKTKVQVEEFKQQYEDFKIQINMYTISR